MSGSWRGHRGRRKVDSRSRSAMTKSDSRGYTCGARRGWLEKSTRERRRRRYPSSTRCSNTRGGSSGGVGSCDGSLRYYRAPSFSVRSYPEGENHYTGRVGNVLAKRYKIVNEVGIGTFGRVFQCWDPKRKRCAAVKVVRDVPKYSHSSLVEAEILKNVNRKRGRGTTHCVELLGHFRHHSHCCLAFECLGPSLYDIMQRGDYVGFPVDLVRGLARQLLEALKFLHGIGLIHTDLKPENILVVAADLPTRLVEEGCAPSNRLPLSTRIKLIDFGGATHVDDEHKTHIVNTRQYRAPEVILELGWSTPSDIWSLGCLLAELLTGNLLFSTHDSLEHLAMMERCVGPFPSRMVKYSPKFKTYFDHTYHIRTNYLPCDSQEYVAEVTPLLDAPRTGMFPECGDFLFLVHSMLKLDPNIRGSAHMLLKQFFSTK